MITLVCELIDNSYPHIHRYSQRKKKKQKERNTTATIFYLTTINQNAEVFKVKTIIAYSQ
jgi:hypothetical protein